MASIEPYRVGILGCFYKKAEYVKDCLAPWIFFRRDNPDSRIAITHHQFREVLDDNYDFETFSEIMLYSKLIDFLSSECIEKEKFPMNEAQVRNIALRYLLEQDLDYIWLLDLDEFYTEKQIYSILDFVVNNDADVYRINMKNYVFDGKTYIRGFCPLRIYHARDIVGLHWDNDAVFKDGSTYHSKKMIDIPESVAFIKHLTWLNSDGKEKVAYHMKHFGHCSYRWNEDNKTLEINPDYYIRMGERVPELFKD
jgi:hypothetical protein